MNEEIKVIVTGFVSIVIVLALLIGTLVLVSKAEDNRDDDIWNNGYCECGGKWEYEQAIGHRYSTSYIYKCNTCGERIEISSLRRNSNE